jgi:glucan phosphoethanolaminetransferase (alkaline phosphatase superfamily)
MIAACLLPTLPNAIYLFSTARTAFFVILWMTSILLVLLPLILGARFGVVLAILGPFAALMPMAAGYAGATGNAPSVVAVQILREGTREEFAAYFAQLVALGAMSVVISACYLWLGWKCGGLRLHLPASVRWCAGTALVLLLAKDIFRNGWESGAAIAFSRMEKMYPVSPLAIAADLKIRGGIIPDRRSVMGNYVVTQDARSTGRQIFVMVVGESARSSSFELYDPKLQTNPLLKKRSDLFVFRDAKSCGTATIQAVPIMLTGSFPSGNEILPFHELSLVEAFRLAGFETSWISSQQGDGDISSFITAFSVNAQHQEFLNGRLERSIFRHQVDAPDEALLAPFRQALARPAKKVFVVLHTIGSHGPYVNRYTPKFERWPVSPEGKQQMFFNRWLPPFSPEQMVQLNHAYDNSVLYTDWFLNEVITILQKEKGDVAMIYASDHGENRPDAAIMPANHGVLSHETTTIPMLVWLSPTLRAEQPGLERALNDHTGLAVNALDIYSTAGGIYRLKTDTIDPTRNLAGSSYREHPRQVMMLDDSILPAPK